MRNDSLQKSKARRQLWLEALETRQLLSGTSPTAMEQLLLEQLNDIRANPAAFGALIGIDLSNIAPAAPLAIDPQLTLAARQHAQDMNDRGYFGQVTPEGTDTGNRLTAVGFRWVSWGESSAAGSAYASPFDALAALIADANSPGHADRNQLLAIDALFKTQPLVGVGIVQRGSGPLTNYYTIDTASTTDGRPYLTGVIYNDANANGRYDAGEGLSNVYLSVSGTNGVTLSRTFTTTTFDSGGYSLQLDPGTYTITATGGGLTAPVTRTVVVGTANVRANIILPPAAVQSGATSWVGLLYRDLLGRVPRADEIRGWTDALNRGVSRATIVGGFIGSTEYAQRLVTGWFQQYLHRTPDAAGLHSFTVSLLNNATEDQVRGGILSSQEYFAMHGGTAAGFVQAIYQDVLGRAPVGHEADGWVNVASAGNRDAVAAGILHSTEFKMHEVGTFYDHLLRRPADGAGLQHFTRFLVTGTDERGVLPGILTSAEYYNHAPTVLWLQGIYRDVLGRDGDGANQLGTWLANVNAGATREGVAYAFLTSTEAQQRLVTSLYQTLLGRAPDTYGLNLFVNLLKSGGRETEVIDSIVASPEYFNRKGTTNREYIRGLYQDLLHRTPSEIEITYWEVQINNGARIAQIVTSFTNSQEFQQNLIASYFNLYLHRSPTTAELAHYVPQLQAGQSDVAIAASILGGDEYRLLHSS